MVVVRGSIQLHIWCIYIGHLWVKAVCSARYKPIHGSSARFNTITYFALRESRSRWPRGLRPLTCWDCWFESRRGHGYLCHVSVVCCQVDVSATGRSLVQRNSTECGASNWVWPRNFDNDEASGSLWLSSHEKKSWDRTYFQKSHNENIMSKAHAVRFWVCTVSCMWRSCETSNCYSLIMAYEGLKYAGGIFWTLRGYSPIRSICWFNY
jgi:hypothetical protein